MYACNVLHEMKDQFAHVLSVAIRMQWIMCNAAERTGQGGGPKNICEVI